MRVGLVLGLIHLGWILLAITPEAIADTPQRSAGEQEEVRALLRRGIEEMNARRYGDALQLFERADELCHCAKALAHVSFAEAGLTHWSDAARHLGVAMRSSDPWISDHQDELQRELRNIEQHQEEQRAQYAAQAVRRRRLVGWGILGGGLVILASGVTALLIADAYFGSLYDSPPEVVQVRVTTVNPAVQIAGGTLSVAGGVIAAAGLATAVWPARERGLPSLAWQLPATESALAMGGRF